MNWRYIGPLLALGGALTYLSLNTGNRGEADVSRLPGEGAAEQMTEVAPAEPDGSGVRTAPRPEGELGVGPSAQEYRWILSLCLVNLGRFHEARDEARKLVELSLESTWAVDAQRHLLVNPLDHPSREELVQPEARGEVVEPAR